MNRSYFAVSLSLSLSVSHTHTHTHTHTYTGAKLFNLEDTQFPNEPVDFCLFHSGLVSGVAEPFPH